MPYTRRLQMPKKALPKSKRWYVDAQIPKSVPLVGGSSFRAGSGTLSKRSLTEIINAQKEGKQKIVAGGNNLSVTHNSVYTFNPFGNISIGTGANARIGASINVRQLRMKICFDTANSTSSDKTRQYRLLVISTDAQYKSGVDTFSTGGISFTDMFMEGTSYGLLGVHDSDRCNILHDQIVTCQQSITGNTMQKVVDLDVLKNRSINYGTPTSNYVYNGKNYYVVIIPDVAYGTGGTTVVGGWRYESVVDFTD